MSQGVNLPTAILLALFCVLPGCSTLQIDEPHILERTGFGAVAMPNDFTTAYFFSDSQPVLCLAPPADAAMIASESIGSTGAESGVSFSDGTGAMSLGGRSSNVLITREVLYRTCEFANNHLSDEDAKLALFEKALDIIQAIAADDQVAGSEGSQVPASSDF